MTMIARRIVATLTAIITLTAGQALAHHSFAAEFDQDKPVKLVGTITEMRWSNPHAWIYIDVKGADGKVVNWACETGGVNALYRRGWRKEDLVSGLQVTIDGWQARNGTPTMNTNTITLPDGRRLFAGAPTPGENAK